MKCIYLSLCPEEREAQRRAIKFLYMPWFCYIMSCSNGALYTGIAKNLERRFKDHQKGRGARYTARYKPIAILWFEKLPDRKSAVHREKEIKGWRREKKLKLIQDFEDANVSYKIQDFEKHPSGF
jgi:putative endonuclease